MSMKTDEILAKYGAKRSGETSSVKNSSNTTTKTATKTSEADKILAKYGAKRSDDKADVSGEAWTRATPSQTKIPSRETDAQEKRGFFSRLGDAIRGGAKGSLASNSNAMSTFYAMGQGGRDAQNREYLAEYSRNLERAKLDMDAMLAENKEKPGSWSERDIQSQQYIIDDWQRKYDAMAKVLDERVQQKATQASYELADDIQQSSAQDIERAKEGLGSVGQVLVDAGASMTQTALDTAANALLGTPGSMGAFAMRAFGGGTQQARQDNPNSTLEQQALYGTASAAKEVFTEKMFNIALPFSHAYGGGALDDAVERGIRSAVNRFAKTDAGKRVLGGALTFGAGAVSEGLEEFIGDWMEWQMPRIYGGEAASAGETLENSLYDFLVGATSGMMGGVITPATYHYNVDETNTQQETAAPTRQAEAVPQTTAANELLTQAAEQASQNGRVNGKTADRILADQDAMAALEQAAGQVVQDGMTKSQQRKAVKSAVEDLARSRETAAVETATTATSQQEKAAETAQVRPAAQQVHDIKRMQQAASALGENGAKALNTVYDGNAASDSFYAGFAAYYEAGISGIDMDKVQSRYAAQLNQAQRFAAYSAGQNDAAASLALEREGVKSATVYGDEAGFVQSEHSASLPKETVRFYNSLARAAGVKIQMAAATGKGGANGWYSNGIIHIANDAENPGTVVAKHEITHRMQEMAPEAYRKYRDYAMSALTELDGSTASIVEQYKSRYAEAGVNLSTEQAMDEIAADFTEALTVDPARFETLAKENRSVARKLLDAVRDFILKVKSLFKGNKTAQNQAAANTYGVSIDTLEEAARLWEEALKATSEQTANKNAAQTDGGTKFSIKRTSQMTLAQQLKMFYDGKMASSDAFYFGATPAVLEKSGFDALPLAMTIGDFRKSTQKKHNIPRRVLKNLMGNLASPLFSFGSGDRAGIVLNDIDGDGYTLLAALERGTDMDRKPVNVINSLYGLEHPAEWIKNQIDSGNKFVLYDEKRANAFLQTYGYMASVGDGIRSTGESVTQNGAEVKTKFSLKTPVEETDKLLALHNKDENSILAAIKLGGLPMPSIAIVKARDGHTKYGPISLVFSKDTIDPQLFRANKVYGGDAWTPTAPRVDYPVNSKKASQVEHELHRLAGDVSVAGGIFGNSAALRSMGIDDTSTRSTAELAEKLASTDTVRAAYLADQGKSLEPVKMDKVWDKFGNGTLQKVVDRLGVNTLAEIEANLETGESVKDALGENAEVIRDILRDYYREQGEPMLRRMAVKRHWTDAEINERRQTRIDNSMDGVSIFTLEDIVHHAWDMYQDGGATKGEIDRMATSDALRSAVDDHAVEEWIAGKLDGLLGEAGIYNGKDPYTPSGNLRSFSQLHYAYTLENIVKAMKEGQEERGGNTWGASAKTLQSVATPEYRSIQEIKADSGRLGMDEGAEYEAKLQAIDDQIGSIITKIKQGNKAHSDNSFVESDIIGSILMETSKGKRTVDAIMRAFSKEGYKISSQTAQDIQAVYQAAAEMPTGYFEAKPQRAVGFDEVLAAVIPDDSSKKLRDGLEQAGVRMLEYKTGDDADRLAKINSVEGARFSLKTVPSVKPTSDDWRPGATFDEVKSAHPTLFALDADEADTRNPTQISGTVKSYRKIYDALQAENFDGTILDASSGLGYGTRAGREEYGFDVDDIEPFPDAKYQPNYTDYSTLDKTYDVIISNAVLNVMPQDLRDAMVVKIGEMLNPGGRAFINVRGTDVKNAGSKVAINDDLMEYFISNTGSYQKGFTSKELVSYLKDALGDGFTVEPTRKFGAVSAIVTRDGDRLSLKGRDILQENAALQEENRLLREQMKDYIAIQRRNGKLQESRDYWQGQTRRTQRVTTDKKAVTAAAKQLIQNYGADIAVKDIQGDLQSLYDYIASGYDGKDELTYTEARRRAEDIAETLVSNAVAVDSDMYDAYSDLRDYLRTTKIIYGKEYHGDIADYGDFRKRQFGRLNLGSEGHTNIDQVYQELSSRWPEFFSEQEQTHPTDQLLHIVEVLDGISEINEHNPFSNYMEQAVIGAANEIMEQFFDLPQTRATFADRQARKLEDAKAKGRQQVQKVREQSNARLEELREQNRQRVQDAIAKERDRRDKQIEKLKTRYREKDAAGRERRNARELRAKIVRHANALSQKLLRPSDKQHIPESLRQATAAALEAINLESAYSVDPATGKRVKDGTGTPAKRTEAFRKLRLAYAEIAKDGGDYTLIIDPDLMDNLNELESMKDTPLMQMGTSQLETVWATIKAVEASIRTANKMLGASRFETISAFAEGIKVDNLTRKDRGDFGGNALGKMLAWGDKKANFDMLTPQGYFHRLGKTGEEMFRMMRSAQDRHITIMQQAKEKTAQIIGKTDINKLEREVHTFDLAGGKLTMSTAQVMSLYELMKREQARDHILKGGIRPDTITGGRALREDRRSAPVHVTAEDLATITGVLTEEQRRMADGLQKFMGGDLAELGNEASMEVYGYRKFNERDYFPIQVDKNQTKRDIAKEAQAATIAGRGFTKSVTPHANNAVMLNSIFDVYASHVNDMATYAAWLPTMENIRRIRDFTFRDEEGNRTGDVKSIIERVFGKNGNPYLNKLVDDINQGIKPSGTGGMNALVGNYKAAAVAANIRVILQQPTAILRAMNTLDPKYLLAGTVKRGDWGKVKKYAPIAVWKDWGYFDINTGRQMKDVLLNSDSALEKVKQASMAPAGKADSFAWARLWNAVEAETKDKRPGLKPGTDEFYRAVASRFGEIIDGTQVVDGLLQRSQIMRSPDALDKMATSFMGEPTKTYNMFVNAVYDLRHAEGKDGRKQAKRSLARTTTALVVSFAVNAVMQSIVDALRDDDKERDYWEKLLTAYTGFTGDEEAFSDYWNSFWDGNLQANFNPLGYIPYAKDILSIAQGYDVSRMDMEPISKVWDAAVNMKKALSGEGKYSLAGASANLLAEAARLLGIPVANLKRDIQAGITTAAIETDSYLMQYRIDKAMLNMGYSGNTGNFMDILYNASINDREAYEIIYADMVASGIQEDKIRNAMETRMKRDQGVESVADLEARYLTPKQEQSYNSLRQRVTGTTVWSAASAEQREALEEDLYDLTVANSSGLKLQEKIDGGAAYGIDEADYLLYRLALHVVDQPTESGNLGSYTGDEVESAIDMLTGLDDEARAYLWEAAGKSEKSNPYK